MILIAHRGNVYGPCPERENDPDYIAQALADGFDVEVDAWWKDGWFLGHDAPTYKTDIAFLQTPGLWVHCKNLSALWRGLMNGMHCFYHADDDYTITSQGYIWAYPGKPGCDKAICVLPELTYQRVSEFAGVCSDYVASYR